MPGFGADQHDRKVFGNEMRALREQKTWTQDDLAGAMNYSLSTVKNLESSYRLPTRDQCVGLDTVFGLPGILERMHERIRGLPLAAGFRPFAPHEAEATTLKTFQHRGGGPTMEAASHPVNTWRKSSYSNGAGGNCVEVGPTPGAVHVRDTKNRDGGTLTLTPATWHALTTTLRD